MKRNIIIALLICIAIVAGVLLRVQNLNEDKITELEGLVDGLEERITSYTIHSILDDPTSFFQLLEDHPEWEEIDAVPYSRCYKHLIATTTADYIFCMAI